MTFAMMIVAVALVMWAICIGLAPAWMGSAERSRGPNMGAWLRSRLQRSRLLRSRLMRSRLQPAHNLSMMI